MNLTNKLKLQPDGKIIFKNFSYLSLLRLFSIISQYIIISILVRSLGDEKYGLFVWAFSVIQYLVIVINFGFNTYAAKYVPENIDQPENLNRVFSTILSFKLFLFFISAALFLFLVYNIPVFKENSHLLLILLGFALGEAIFPIWLFQGKERLEIPTKIIFAFKMLLVLSTLIFITSEEHLLRYAFLLTAAQILIGLTGLYFAFSKLNMEFIRVSKGNVSKVIKDALPFF